MIVRVPRAFVQSRRGAPERGSRIVQSLKKCALQAVAGLGPRRPRRVYKR
jgi:hypothetical protein